MSYAHGEVSVSHSAGGGLVGESRGSISAAYSTASVNGGSRGEIGGLIGQYFLGNITASYTTGAVSSDAEDLGGLIGKSENEPAVSDSYWDTETTGQSSSAGGVGKTTSELQSPTGYSGIYTDWDVDVDGDNVADIGDDPWNFGSAIRYPVLKVDFDGNGESTWEEFGDQRPLPDKPTGLSAAPGNQQATLSWDDPNDITITGYQLQQDDGVWENIARSYASTRSESEYWLTSLPGQATIDRRQ